MGHTAALLLCSKTVRRRWRCAAAGNNINNYIRAAKKRSELTRSVERAPKYMKTCTNVHFLVLNFWECNNIWDTINQKSSSCRLLSHRFSLFRLCVHGFLLYFILFSDWIDCNDPLTAECSFSKSTTVAPPSSWVMWAPPPHRSQPKQMCR